MRTPIFSLILLAGFAVLGSTGAVVAAPSMGPAVGSAVPPSAIQSVGLSDHDRRVAEMRRREALRHHHH
jgi:hypothetical protein